MVKSLLGKFIPFWFFILLTGFISCSTDNGDEPPVPPEPEDGVFISLSDSLVLDRKLFGERLGLETSNPLLLLLPDKKIRVDAIRYRSEDPTGDSIEASGIITYPAEGDFRGVVVGLHHSIGADREAPSSVMAGIESVLSFFGYVVISPDYIGFGSTAELPQTYIHAATSAGVTADMVWGTREYMESRNHLIHDEIYVMGYSQGGYAALAFARLAEQEYATEIPLKHIFAGGGPYVPLTLFDLFLASDAIENPATALLSIIGYDYGDNLKLDYTRIFQEPLLSNYMEWCVSKKYTLGQINRALETNKLSELLHPDFFTQAGNSETNKVRRSFSDNSLIEWIPKTPLTLVHGSKDKTVPYINAEKAYDAFKAAGSQVELIDIQMDHTSTAIPFYLEVLKHLAF